MILCVLPNDIVSGTTGTLYLGGYCLFSYHIF